MYVRVYTHKLVLNPFDLHRIILTELNSSITKSLKQIMYCIYTYAH